MLKAQATLNGSLGCVEYFVPLLEVMKHKTDFDMDGINEDLFFLSNGHITPVLYSVLARRGYFDIKELSTFRTINSRLQDTLPLTINFLVYELPQVL